MLFVFQSVENFECYDKNPYRSRRMCHNKITIDTYDQDEEETFPKE